MKQIKLDLDLLKYKNQLMVSVIENTTFIFDPIRKKNIIAQPEEMVRQLIIQYFTVENIFPLSRMAVEKKLTIDGQLKRFDLLVFDRLGQPYLLVECKSFDVALTDKTMRQIAVYNQKLRCPYLLVSNGIQSMYCAVDFASGEVTYLDTLISELAN
jgi:hypothetical protein